MQFKRHIMAGVLAAFAAWASADQLITSSVPPSSVIENGAVTVYVFSNATANATFTPVVPVVLDRALVVGGGGAGGWTIGGGGGAGGLVDFHPETPLMLVPGNTYSFSVGAGGYDQSEPSIQWPDGDDGENSSLDLGVTNIVAYGGGGGAGWHGASGTSAGHDGGCGGGSCNHRERGAAAEYRAVGSQGGNGGASLEVGGTNSCPGGGGGAGGNGTDGQSGYGGNGGDGYLCNITGTAMYYAGGGGAGAGNDCGNAGKGGLGGGGDGSAINSNLPGTPGTDGLGGGGGGGSYLDATHGGAGGCGTVILSMSIATESPVASVTSATAVSTTNAVISCSLLYAGLDASTADFYYRVWMAADPAPVFVAGPKNVGLGSVELPRFTGLIPDTLYSYEITATNNNGVAIDETLSGTFRTWARPLDSSLVAVSDPASCKFKDTPIGSAIVFTGTSATNSFTPVFDLVLDRALVVGGGGAGGWTIGGGGGGGGVVDYAPKTEFILHAGQTYYVSVGEGGWNQNTVGNWPIGLNGGDSALILGTTNIVAIGGGGGGSWNSNNGQAGGCGGGTAGSTDFRAVGSQGGNGGRANGEKAGGGGGAGQNGQDGNTVPNTAGKGGDGYLSEITGEPVYYGGGGGGGGGNSAAYGGAGGLGGGGCGQDANSDLLAEPGKDGLGGGGGGGSHSHANCGGNGGSGTVIVAVRLASSPSAIASFTPAVTSTTAATLTGKLFTAGDNAATVDVYMSTGFSPDKLSTPALVEEDWEVGDEWSYDFTGLAPGKRIYYAFTLVNDRGVSTSEPVTGFFTPLMGTSSDASARVIESAEGLVYVFTNAAAGTVTFTPAVSLQVNRALLVGGGGAGGWTIAGGGGAGGVVQYRPDDLVLLGAGMPVAIVVGEGGDNVFVDSNDGAYWTYGRDGGASSVALSGTNLVAMGGGGGGGWSGRSTGADGGCGGGSANNGNVNAIGYQGGNGGKNNGEKAGGGGGAGEDGQDGQDATQTAGKGGDGIASDITGSRVYYAGGGGGGAGNSCNYGGAGGLGGGGRGSDKDSVIRAENGVDGLGGGGGGGSHSRANCGGHGGCGTVILSLSLPGGSAPVVTAVPTVETPSEVVLDAVLGHVGDNAETADAWLAYGPVSSDLPASASVKTGWLANESLPIMLSGLQPGVEYAFALAVTNNLGAGAIVEGTFDTGKAAGAYIAPDGNDATGDGSQGNPFRTLTHAVLCVDVGADDMPVVHAAPGLYDVAAGELFPVELAGVQIIGTGDIGEFSIFDAGNESANVFSVTEGATSLSNLWIRNSSNAAIIARGATVDVSDSEFTQSLAASYYGAVLEDGWNFLTDGRSSQTHYRQDADLGVFDARSASFATFDRCRFTGMDRYALFQSSYDRSRFTLNDCVAASNTVTRGVFSSSGYDNVCSMQLVFRRSDFIANRCRFIDQGGNGYVHDCAECSIAYICGHRNQGSGEYASLLDVDRCRFLGNAGGNLFGFDYCSPNVSVIRNSLFVDNYAHQALFQGYSAALETYNSTFIRNSGNFSAFYLQHTLYDCIIADGGDMTFNMPIYGAQYNAGGLKMFNTIYWNTPDGLGWIRSNSDFIEADPCFENAAVASDDPSFDATLRPYSPAIDAGVNGRIDSTLDLAGNARVADNDRDGTDTIDLGCYESLFADNPAPAFCMDAPGVFSALRGTTHDVALWIEPTPNGDVTASVAYPEDGSVSGPETLTFVEGAATLTLSFAPDSTNDWTRAVVSADGIAPLAVDAYVSGCVVTIGGGGMMYIRDGETIVLPVKLDLEGAVASSVVPVAIQSTSGDGANDISWTGGDGIAAGASSTVGGLSLTGHSGVNTVTLQVGAGYTFAETETEYVTVTVVGYPGWMAVDPANGDDDQYVGTMASPFKTVNRALEVLRDGDTVRMLPGTYDASTQTFPWEPRNVALVGYSADGDADSADFVVDGGNAVYNVIVYSGLDGSITNGLIENLAIRETTSCAVLDDGGNVTIRNCAFTQSVEDFSGYGAITIRDNGSVAAEDCSFTGIRRFAAVSEVGHYVQDAIYFTATRCTFANNCSGYAAIAGDHGGVLGHAGLYDCDFIANSVGPDNYARISECFRSPTIYLRQGGLTIERCRFLGNVGGPVIAETYFTTYVRDSLFAGNSAVLAEGGADAAYVYRVATQRGRTIAEGDALQTGIFDGYGMQIQLINCTLVGNSGGYNSCNCTPYFYNSIIADDGPFSVMPYGNWMDHQPIRLESTIAYDMAEGVDGFRTNESHNVFFDDPKFKNVSVPWNDARFDARLSGSSPAIDAGRNDFLQASQLVDLAGEPRVQAGLKGAVEPFTVDLGCYERKYVEAGTLIMVR